MGAELPVSYQIVNQVRVEFLPTLQYTRAYGGSSMSAQSSIEPNSAVGLQEVQVTTTTEPDKGEMQAGVGIGISIVLP
jgi:hypothetical protein